MKKYYLGAMALVCAGVVSAQTVGQPRPAYKAMNLSEASAKTQTAVEKAIPFWTNDFSAPSDWTIANAGSGGVPPHTAGDWTITTNLSAAPVSALNPAGFTTAANGYAIINSDAAGDGQTQNATIVTSSSIDCSTHANVSLKFQQTTRHYQEAYYVVVSNDGGMTWTDFQVNTGMAVNTNSANPATVQVNISSVAANQADVRIGFRYVGTYDWFWAVDDVQMFETEDYDLSINGLYWGALGTWGLRLPYYQTPLDQIADITFGGLVQNIGALTQNDCVFNVAIASAGYSSSSAAGTLAPNEADTLDATAMFTPGATAATYAVTATVTSSATDASPTDNAYAGLSFSTNNFIYARDMGTVQAGSYNQGNGYEMGNVFDIFTGADLYGADVWIHANTEPGTEAYVTLYDISTGDFVYVTSTDPIIVTPGAMKTFVFDSPVPLAANASYVLVAGSYGSGGANDDLVLGSAGVSEAQTTFLLDGNDNTGTWYYSTSTPMVRMNFDPSLSVYPNPASDKTIVSFDANGTDAVVVVTDLSGKVISTMNTATGKAEINTSAFAAGMYNVTVTSNNTSATTKLVVRK
jgi:hypothetical protein